MTTPSIGAGDSMPPEPGAAGSVPAPAPARKDPGALLADVLDHFETRSKAPAPQNLIVAYVTREYLARLDPNDPPSPRLLEQQLLAAGNAVIKAENAKIPQGDGKLPLAKHLTCWQIAQILLALHHVIRIAPNAEDTDREYDLLAMYCAAGPGCGTYAVSEDEIRATARRYHTQLSLNDFKEVLAVLREDGPRTHRCSHRDLVPVGNGVFFYGTEDRDVVIDGRQFSFQAKGLHPFDPAMVFLAKSHVDYIESPPKQVITHPVDRTVWDIESWMEELSDDQGVPELLWEIIGAIIRPQVRWGKTAWFYSEQGNNGKGTLCTLMRNMIGPGSHTSIPLSDLGKDFALEPLVRANAIIVDENDVGTFIDKAANLKAIVTNDVIQINRKHRVPIAYQFFGLMVQCLNEFPRVKDKSESFYRRQLFVPFCKSFTGTERKYIRDDYLQRGEVLEYALWYVLNNAGAASPGDYYELSEPLATRAVLAEYKEANDPVRAFWEEFRERFVWDLLPFPFLYDLYKVWFARVSPSGSPVSRQQFVSDLVGIARNDPEWHCADKKRKVRPGQLMAAPETLIAEYELTTWYSPSYKGSDPNKLSRPMLQASYRGLLRRAMTSAAVYPARSDAGN